VAEAVPACPALGMYHLAFPFSLPLCFPLFFTARESRSGASLVSVPAVIPDKDGNRPDHVHDIHGQPDPGSNDDADRECPRNNGEAYETLYSPSDVTDQVATTDSSGRK
jgi:hypothetical protein